MKSNALFLQESSTITATVSLITNESQAVTDIQRAKGQDWFLGHLDAGMSGVRLHSGDGASVLWLSVRLDSPSNHERYPATSTFKLPLYLINDVLNSRSLNVVVK